MFLVSGAQTCTTHTHIHRQTWWANYKRKPIAIVISFLCAIRVLFILFYFFLISFLFFMVTVNPSAPLNWRHGDSVTRAGCQSWKGPCQLPANSKIHTSTNQIGRWLLCISADIVDSTCNCFTVACLQGTNQKDPNVNQVLHLFFLKRCFIQDQCLSFYYFCNFSCIESV